MAKKYTADTFEGDVTGNITGDLTGNVTGSASENVLKAGDTMTGNLNITKTSARLQLDGSTTGVINIRNGTGAYDAEGKITFGNDSSVTSTPALIQCTDNPSTNELLLQYGTLIGTNNQIKIRSTNTYFTDPLRIGADSTSNEFDDYEEGTYTPGVFGYFGGLVNVIYTTQLGKYIKIGPVVHCFFEIVFTGGPATGNILGLSGLPFVPSDDGNAYGGGSIGVAYKNRWNFVYTTSGGADSLIGVRKLGTSATLFFNMDDGNTTNSMRVDALTGDYSNAMSIVAHITYRTTS